MPDGNPEHAEERSEIAYNVTESRELIERETENCDIVSKREGKKRVLYYNIPATFDIETTNMASYKEDGTIDAENSWAYMYHWQFCIGSSVVFGRTWEEFECLHDLLSEIMELRETLRLVIFVHNLGFEFQFFKDIIGESNFTNIFARKKRKPLYIRERSGIEWRCSWYLSNMSLEKFCENSELCVHWKMSGDEFDYSIIRTPATKLSPRELGYCYNDVRGLAECIASYLQHDTIATLPLTNTGFVRRDVRRAMSALKYKIRGEALTYEQYLLARKTFRGGDTHASRFHAGEIVEDVYCVDEASAYPAVMMIDYMPRGKFYDVTDCNNFEWYCSRYCVMMTIVLADVCVKPGVVMPYIDVAHSETLADELVDNGRILGCQWLRINITEIDWEIIKEQYYYTVVCVERLCYAERGELPEELKKVVIEYYYGKTTLKKVKEKRYEYLKSKNRLNAIFGMMVTDLISPEITYAWHEWKETKLSEDAGREAVAKHYKYKCFISYQWGIWITAHARRRLNSLSAELGMDNLYQDTDSKKFINSKHFDYINRENERIRQTAEKYGAYVDYDGRRYHLGVWDYSPSEDHYDRFRTWGAKKYAVEISGELEITVAGMSKVKGARAIGSLENFRLGQTWGDCGRTVSVYTEDIRHPVSVMDPLEGPVTFTTASSCAIIDTTYTLGLSDTYYDLIVNKIDDL